MLFLNQLFFTDLGLVYKQVMRRNLQCFLITIICSICFIGDLSAADKQKVGLVLAGGGAAGIAHVGVIRELERLGIRPDCIVGTSMGAIIAGLYAAGYSADELEKVVLDIDWSTILNDYSDRSTLHPMRRDSRTDPFSVATDLPIGKDDHGIRFVGGVVDGEKLLLLLRELTSEISTAGSFDDLPIPFRAIATDLETGDQVIMKGGDLATALRASMSIPALFPAVERGGKILVDGGVVNNFPTDVAREFCADIVIGVNLPSVEPSRRSLQTVTGSIAQLIRLMVGRQQKANQAALTAEDILILPQTGEIGLLEFERASDAVSLGAQAVLDVKDKLLSMGLEDENRMLVKAVAGRKRDSFQRELIQFDSVVIKNRARVSDEIIRSKLALDGSGEILARDLQRRLLKIYGLDLFGAVTYHLDQTDGVTTLVINADRRSTGHSEYSVGLGLEDDFRGGGDYTLGVGAGFTQLNPLAGRVDIALGVGSKLGGRLKYEQPLSARQTNYLVASLGFLNTVVPIHTEADGRVADFRVLEGLASLDYIWTPRESLRLGIGASYRRNRVELRTGAEGLLAQAGLDEEWEGSPRLGALFDYDTLDNVDLPHAGSQLSIRYNVDVENDGENVGEVLIDALTVHTIGDFSFAGFLSVNGEIEPDGLDPHFLGGFQRLSGFSEDQLFGNIATVVGARVYRNVSYDSLFGGERFIGGSVEFGGVWDEWSQISTAEALLHGSIFTGVETPFGPLLIGLGFGEDSKWAARFSLGNRF